MNFNEEALITLERVSNHFGIELKRFEPIECNTSIGIEVELTFKSFFPVISEKYFKNKTWDSYTHEEKEIIDEEITIVENTLGVKHRLEKTLELGIKKGRDCYWEFALDPVTDLSIILTQLQLLSDLDLLPDGEHSLHMTVANLENNQETHWIFFLAEMLFSSKKRIETGFSKDKKLTYFRKGKAGLLLKRWQLVDCKEAIEFRSLELVIKNRESSITHKKLEYICKIINDSVFRNSELERCKTLFSVLNMPNKNWGNYKDNPEIWDSFSDNYDNIQTILGV
jgi:hypothetical protein